MVLLKNKSKLMEYSIEKMLREMEDA